MLSPGQACNIHLNLVRAACLHLCSLVVSCSLLVSNIERILRFPICFAAWACWVHDVMLRCSAQLRFAYRHIPCKVCSDDLYGAYIQTEKLISSNSQNWSCARYPPHGRRTVVLEDGVQWDRVRAPPVDTLAHDLHTSDCLHELRPGDHIEIQWRRNKEFPYGMFPSHPASNACF